MRNTKDTFIANVMHCLTSFFKSVFYKLIHSYVVTIFFETVRIITYYFFFYTVTVFTVTYLSPRIPQLSPSQCWHLLTLYTSRLIDLRPQILSSIVAGVLRDVVP